MNFTFVIANIADSRYTNPPLNYGIGIKDLPIKGLFPACIGEKNPSYKGS